MLPQCRCVQQPPRLLLLRLPPRQPLCQLLQLPLWLQLLEALQLPPRLLPCSLLMQPPPRLLPCMLLLLALQLPPRLLACQLVLLARTPQLPPRPLLAPLARLDRSPRARRSAGHIYGRTGACRLQLRLLLPNSGLRACFGGSPQGVPSSQHCKSRLPSATATASQHSGGISTGVKPVSASRGEPGQHSQHDAALHELEAALSELAAAEEQVEPEGEQLQLAVGATAQELESGEVIDQLSVGGGACSKWHSKRSFRGLDSIKGLSDDMLQHGRWLKVAAPIWLKFWRQRGWSCAGKE